MAIGVNEIFRRAMTGYEELDEKDKQFIKQFLENGTVKEPTESMMIPTESLHQLNDLIRQNKTYCFKIDPGVAGWCATCKVRTNLKIFLSILTENIST